MTEIKNNIPDQKELEKELNDYLSKKYGDRVRLGVSMLVPKEDVDETDFGSGEKTEGMAKIKFNMKPEEMEAFLDDFVVKQRRAKEVLATKICTHFNRVRYMEENHLAERFDGVGHIKNNIIMAGPTGVGKTYIIKLIAKKLGVPFVKGDATKFSETGYVGGDVEDLVRDLVHEADGDMKLAEYGIIYIDEIDKIASTGNLIGPDVSRAGVQRSLLKPMEETEVDLKVPHDPISLMEAIEQYRKTGKKERKKINTKNILFIVSGAFNGLEKIIKKRLNSQELGFAANVKTKEEQFEDLRYVRAEDLIEYGFESEFIGRLPVSVVFDRLETEDLYQILVNYNSPIVQGKKRDFMSYGIDIRFEDKALQLIAESAYRQNTGARGLVSAVEEVLIGFEKKLPSTGIKKLIVTEELVLDPEKELERLLVDPDSPDRLTRYERCLADERGKVKEIIQRRIEDYTRRFGEVLTRTRIDIIVDHVVIRGADIQKSFEEMVQAYKKIRFSEKRFFDRFDMRITFDDGAVDRIMEKILVDGQNVRDILSQLMGEYEHGLRLIREKNGQDEFILTRLAVDSPDTYVQQMLRDYTTH